jgi:hypothetical protein
MRVTMLLCDAAQQVGGKLYVLGGGWTHALARTTGQSFNMALAIVIAVPWDQTNVKHDVQARLLTEDGQPVNVEGQQVQSTGQIEVGRPTGVKAGSELNAPIVLSFDGIPLAPGGYVWELLIGSESTARTPFWVVATQGIPQPQT